MSLWEKACTFVIRCGAPTKFVARSIISSLFPGSGPVLEVIEKVIDCVRETARDNLDTVASQQDLAHIEKMFDLLLGDLQEVVERLKRLEDVPAIAQDTLFTTLLVKDQCFAAAQALQEQGLQLSAMQAEQKKQSAGLGEMAAVQRCTYKTILDFIKEQRSHHVQLNERLEEQAAELKEIKEGIAALRRGHSERSADIFAALSTRHPDSAALAVAEAASQAAAHRFVGAAKTLARACRLRPGDVQLAEMSRIATKYAQPVTPPQSPDTKKRPQPGDTLDGWRLEKLLGFGGWGQVFLARKGADTRALKVMHAELSQNAEFVKRFKREMGTLIGLGTHPHLVRIDPDHLFDKADDWNCWYYVMEYVEGTTLARYLEKHGVLTFGQVRLLFTGIAEGLASAHARGIIHRDIKPANILIRKKPEAGQGHGVLVDFGLAGLVDVDTRPAGYTALFAAQEQMRHGVSDCRSDVYALTATIYYCLLHNDADKRGRFKAKFLPAEVPADVRALLERCLDNDPDEREPDAGAFVKIWLRPATPTPVDLSIREPINQKPPPPAAGAAPKAGDVLTMRVSIPEPTHRPGELFLLRFAVPDLKHRPGELAALTWKPVPCQPAPKR